MHMLEENNWKNIGKLEKEEKKNNYWRKIRNI